MAPKNKFYRTFYTKTQFDNYISTLVAEYLMQRLEPIKSECYKLGVDAGTTYGIDMAILALGRLGKTEDELREFMKKVQEASNDYCDLFDVDIEENNDKQLWWSGAKMDEELREYAGENYPSFAERYHGKGNKE